MEDDFVVDLNELSESDLEEAELVPEYPKYVVVGDSPTEVFSLYTVLILSFLIMYPIYRVLRNVVGSVKVWRQ